MSEEQDMIKEVPGSSPKFRTELAEQFAELAPEAVADGKIDVEKLKELLEGDASDTSERFGLFWPGKKRAMRAAQTPTTATLRPDKENSKDWDTTKNVFIEGDNLEVLKILQKHYHGKIKMIYIDPPYNTGNDFVYPDNYKEGLETYLEWSKQVNEDGKKLSSNSESEGRYHSNWLNMMYPRLKLARNLLADDGVLCVSIDEAEGASLRKVCDEIYGEANHVSTFIIDKTAQGANQSATFKQQHEMMLMYTRKLRVSINPETAIEIDKKKYKYRDDISAYAVTNSFDSINSPLSANKGRGYTVYYDTETGDAIVRDEFDKYTETFGEYDEGLIAEGYEPIRPGIRNGVQYPWNWMISRFEQQYKQELVFQKNRDGQLAIYHKNRATGFVKDTTLKKFDTRKSGNLLLTKLMGGKFFDYPKSIDMLSWVLTKHLSKDGIVLDFFSGSCTTGHAVLKQNVLDGGARQHIQVQLPEPTPLDSDARKAGFKTIAELARTRLSKAGAQITKEFEQDLASQSRKLDTGFRSYKLADTNFTKWRTDSDTDATQLEQHLLDRRESADDNATPDDLLTEILIKQGHSLIEQIRDRNIDGLSYKAVVRVDDEDGDEDTLVLAYLDEHTKPTLAQLREAMEVQPAQFIMLEDAFQGDDELKTNLAQICKTNGIELWTA